MGDDPLMTKEEGSVQLADAAWTLRGAFAKSHSINLPHPGGSGRQVTYIPFSRNFVMRAALFIGPLASCFPPIAPEPGDTCLENEF
jgi:hypothetical protein